MGGHEEPASIEAVMSLENLLDEIANASDQQAQRLLSTAIDLPTESSASTDDEIVEGIPQPPPSGDQHGQEVEEAPHD
jgi:hypothetical protein